MVGGGDKDWPHSCLVALSTKESGSLHQGVSLSILYISVTVVALETLRVVLVVPCHHDWAGDDQAASVTGISVQAPIVLLTKQLPILLKVPAGEALMAAGTPKTIRMPIAFQSPNEGVVLNGVPALRTQTNVFYNI